ncbi:MAG: hypothetical protein HC825_03980 [Oscillatoriales cyanobacterium RM1_1_9]|nr:hypothetical protein [Oscillatoriales cyanobacterium RM1_1_9]
MTRKRITLSLLMGLSLLSSNVLLLKENSALAKSVTPLERTSKTSLVITQVDNSSPETGVNPESDFFKQAEAEFNVLGEYGKDLYVLYRLVEKLARANNLDERNWRFRLVNQYEINASASELNLLTFYAGLIDQLHGDYERSPALSVMKWPTMKKSYST